MKKTERQQQVVFGYKTIVKYNGELYELASALSESEFFFNKKQNPYRRYMLLKKSGEVEHAIINDLIFVSQTPITLKNL